MAVFNGRAEDIQSKQNMLESLESEEGADKYPSVLGTKIYVTEKREIDDENSRNTYANAIKVTKSGEVVRADDVSPIEHTVKLFVVGNNTMDYLSTAKVHRYGGNLLDLSEFAFSNSVYNAETGIATSNIKNGYFCSISSTSPELLNLLYANRGKELCFSVKGELKNGALLSVLIEGDRSSLGQEIEYYEALNNGENHLTFAVPTDFISITRVEFRFNRQGQAFTDTATQFSEFMLNYGTSKLPYEPFIESATYTPNADGTLEIPSLSPTMTLFADAEGANIDVTYNADTKKYIDNKFAELQAAMISLGGNA